MMVDTALVISTIVTQVWRDTPAAALPEPTNGEYVEFIPEDHVTCGQTWPGSPPLIDPLPSLDIMAMAQMAYAAAQDVVFGCILTGKTVPLDWKAYGAAARQILAGADNVSLPALPAPPVGV